MPTSGSSALVLLHRAGQCADELFVHSIGTSNLTPRQFAVMAAIASSEEPSQTTLVNQTGVDRSTMADIVRRLTLRGLVQRRRTKRDARRYIVRLTAKGEEALQLGESGARRTDERLLNSLPPPQRTLFIRALERILATVDLERPTPVGRT